MNGTVNRRFLVSVGSLAWLASVSNAACTFNVASQETEPAGGRAVQLPSHLGGQADNRAVSLAPKATATAVPLTSEAGASVQSTIGELSSDGGAKQSPNTISDRPHRCPERMIEVDGNFCTDIMHRCIKGGRTHTEEETEEPEPYYCDAYQPGFAKCLDKEEPKHFCIDEFEYPNQSGAIPIVMVSWFEAKRLCEVQSKRLCGDDEWTLACEGPERLPFPYGWARHSTACNIGHLWVQPNDGILGSRSVSPSEIQAEVDRLSRRVPSGALPRCKSPYGVMDMSGNVDEWTTNVMLHGKPYQSAFKGGHWISGARNRCRPVTVSHDENTYYYCEGFRCCAEQTYAEPQMHP
jgi:hypothetical protein